MTTAEFIKHLQKEDPSGEAHIRLDGGIPTNFELKPGYYDGPFEYFNKDGKWVRSTKGTKVDVYCQDKLEFIIENVIEYWNPFKDSKEGLWDKCKDKFLFELGGGRESDIERFFNPLADEVDTWVENREYSYKRYLDDVIDLHKRGCRFFRKRFVENCNNWKFVNEKDPTDIGRENLAHTYPISESGVFVPVDTKFFPGDIFLEYVLKTE